jgi:hypothetical protein
MVVMVVTWVQKTINDVNGCITGDYVGNEDVMMIDGNFRLDNRWFIWTGHWEGVLELFQMDIDGVIIKERWQAQVAVGDHFAMRKMIPTAFIGGRIG